jgi:PhnB protein
MSKVKAVPEGFHTVTPHLTVRNAAQAIEFYKKAFGAEVLNIMRDGDSIMHAALKIGDSILMLNDEYPQMGSLSPLSTNGAGVTMHIYTDNVDTAFDRAVAAGATVSMPLMDQFWGDRYGLLTDPYGHKWSLAAHVRDMSADEVRKAQEEAFAKMPKSA